MDPGRLFSFRAIRADTVMHIEDGCVELSVMATDGEEAICGRLGAGAFVGEEALGARVTRPHTMIAMTQTEMVVVVQVTPSLLHVVDDGMQGVSNGTSTVHLGH